MVMTTQVGCFSSCLPALYCVWDSGLWTAMVMLLLDWHVCSNCAESDGSGMETLPWFSQHMVKVGGNGPMQQTAAGDGTVGAIGAAMC